MKTLILLLLGVSGLFAHGGWGFRGGCCMGWWPFGGYFGGIFGIIIALGTIYIVFLLLKSLRTPGNHHDMNQSSALEILKARYARGEISKEEFERMKEEIQNLS